MREEELIVYRTLRDGELLQDMAWLMSHYMEAEEGKDTDGTLENMRRKFHDCIHRLVEEAGNYGFHGNLWHCYLANFLVNHENSYSHCCEMQGEVKGSINDAVLHDIVIFKEFYDYDFSPLCEKLHVDTFSMIENYTGSYYEDLGFGKSGRAASKVYNTRICARICELAEKFCQNHTPEEMKDTLTQFYKEYGVGKFGLHKAFRIVHDTSIEPIRNIAHVSLDDLVGYDLAKKKLIENTEAFVSGKKANNCLLYGDAGTGKSSCIKAIANEYYSRGLRIIEVYKHQFQCLNQVNSKARVPFVNQDSRLVNETHFL